jgi:uncharacterized protein (TIGR02271 family)
MTELSGGRPAASGGRTRIVLDDGQVLLVPPEALEEDGAERYRLLLGSEELRALSTVGSNAVTAAAAADGVIPVVQEELVVGKRVVEAGRVRVRKVVREEETTVDEPLTREEVTVERVPVERFVDAVPPTRQDGDETVISIVEEVIVIEKRLLLKEELHVRKRRVEERRPQTVTLRREEAVIERVDAGPDAAAEVAAPQGTAGGAARDAASEVGKAGTTVARKRGSKRT